MECKDILFLSQSEGMTIQVLFIFMSDTITIQDTLNFKINLKYFFSNEFLKKKTNYAYSKVGRRNMVIFKILRVETPVFSCVIALCCDSNEELK